MWTWIFGIGFALASLAAIVFARGASLWKSLSDFWKTRAAHDEKGRKAAERERRETQLLLLDALATYCRRDFHRRALSADIAIVRDGEKTRFSLLAAPAARADECWRFSVTLEGPGRHAYIGATVQPGGRDSDLFLRVEPGEDWHRQGVLAIEAAGRFPGSRLSYQEAMPIIDALLGQEREPRWKTRIAFGPPPRTFPSLDDPMDDMD